MKRILLWMCLVSVLILVPLTHCDAVQGVAIERVISSTRSELGQLASSTSAREIADLIDKFDRQYATWSNSCNGEQFAPDEADDACRDMARQMRETGVKLYGKLAEYLPEVAARYEQGARSASAVLDSSLSGQSPSELYEDTMNGISGAPKLGELSRDSEGSPFDVVVEGYNDPVNDMIGVLHKLVPDFGKETPESVRAANLQVSMLKKAKQARYLAGQFERARFVLESQREYGAIILSATKAVDALPEIMKIQYTGTRISSKPNRKVLDYYAGERRKENPKSEAEDLGGFEKRS